MYIMLVLPGTDQDIAILGPEMFFADLCASIATL